METTVLVILLAVALAVLRLERSVSEVMTLAAFIGVSHPERRAGSEIAAGVGDTAYA